MRLSHRGGRPAVDPTAYVAPSAVLSGEVRVGAHSRILHGAVLTAEGGIVEVGRRCIVMEQAVLRGTRAHPTRLGDHVLIGPHAYLSGCVVEDEVFVATGAMVFNGATLGRAASVALGGAVHIGCRVPAGTRVPIGWVAVGDPARLHPPSEAEPIRAGLEEMGGFLPFTFGIDPHLPREEAMRQAMARYSDALGRHRDDQPVPDGGG